MKRILLLFLFTFFSCILSAQDPQFTMPYSSLMDLNPAFAGSAGCSRVAGGYRNQWPNISGNYVSSYLSYDQYVKGVSGGMGLAYLHDAAGQGSITSDRISAIYSYRVRISWASVLCFGFEGAYAQRRVDWSKIGFGSLINNNGTLTVPSPSQNKEAVSYPDFSAGVLDYGRRFYGGFSVFHLTEPEEGLGGSSAPLPMKYVGHFGMNMGNVDSAKAFSVSPSILYLEQQDFRSLNLNVAVKYGMCVGGVGYRNGDAILLSVGFVSRTLRMAYSYDVTISKLGIVSGGSHEIALSYIFNRKRKPANFISFSSAAF